MDRPLRCADCGVSLSQTGAIWLGPTWDAREPFCPVCAPAEQKRLRRAGV